MYDNSSKPTLQSPLILFATPPPLDQLSAITICLPRNIQSMARFQPQVIKCREFIFTEPEVIGTPSADINEHYFHLVTKGSWMKSGKLQTRLARIGLQGSKPFPVSTELYESCLRYTLLARLSPTWNKAGAWLIQGRDFLTHKGCANAVKMDVNVHHNELFFTLEAAVLKLAPLQVTDLDIVGRQLEDFLRNPSAQIHHDSIASDWCFILPSMKRGRIVRISHDIPEDSPFMTYRDLKRHWKNTYGYRLPENEDGMNFYQINFGPLGGKLFTYPEVCLRGRELQRVARVDPKPILRAFMQDLQSKFPTVCGCLIKLQSKAKFPYVDLLSSGQEAVKNQPNLTNKMNSIRPAVYRTKEEIDKMLSSGSEVKTPHFIGSFQKTGSDCTSVQTKAGGLNVLSTVSSQPLVDNKENEKSGKSQCLVNNDIAKAMSVDNVAQMMRTQQEIISVHSHTVQQTSERKTAQSSLCTNVNSTHEETPVGITVGTNKGKAKLMSGAIGTPCSDSRMNDQHPDSRKLFPQFNPKKSLPQMEINQSDSGKKIVPIFRPQKKPLKSVTEPKAKSLTSVHKPFIPLLPSQTTQGDNKSKPSFQISCMPQSCQKAVPSFNRIAINRPEKSFQKSLQMSAIVVKKGQNSGKTRRDMKEQKDKKTVKRPKTAKDCQAESKKAKKLKKAEA